MGMIVVVCAAFGLTVSEAKTEIMCLRTKGMPESTTVFSVEAVGQVYNQTNEFVYLGGNVSHMPTCSSRSTSAYETHVAASRSTPSNYTTNRALKIRILRAKVLETILYGCVTWRPYACHYNAPPPRAHHSLLTR